LIGATGVAKPAPVIRITASTATAPGQRRSLSGQITRGGGLGAGDAEGTYEISN